MNKAKADKPQKRDYFVPAYGVSVEAESLEEAVKLAEAASKAKDNDGE